MTFHPRVETVANALSNLGATGEIRMLPDSARTAQEAATALGIEVGAIANSLIFDAGGEAILVLTSGAHRVDTLKVSAEQSLPPLKRADADFVRAATGQAIGGVAPLGHPAPLRTYVDTDLGAFDQIWAAAGHPHAVFPTTFDELVLLTGGAPIEVD